MNIEQRVMNEISNFLESDKIEIAVNSAMEKVVNELFSGYRGLKEVIKNTLQEQLTPVIEKHDYSEYVLKLEHILQAIIKEQASDTNHLLKNFEGVVKSYPEKMTLTEIFEEYCNFVSKKVSTLDLEIDYDDDPTYQDVECEVTYCRQERRFGDSGDECGILEFSCEEDDSLNASVCTYKWSFQKNFRLRNDTDTAIKEIKHLNEFEVFILGLSLNGVEIEIDEDYIADDSVEVEERPEFDVY